LSVMIGEETLFGVMEWVWWVKEGWHEDVVFVNIVRVFGCGKVWSTNAALANLTMRER
jgi:hypothetical protein